MSGGVGFTQYASATYTDNILEDFCYKGDEIAIDMYGERGKAPVNMDTIERLVRAETDYCLTQYEAYPTTAESHFGGSVRACCAAAGAGTAVASATASAQAAINGWALSMLLHYERVGRLGFYGYDLQDQANNPNSFSYRSLSLIHI